MSSSLSLSLSLSLCVYQPMFICICLYYDCQECRYNGEVTHGWNSFPPFSKKKNKKKRRLLFIFVFIFFVFHFVFCLPEQRHISVLCRIRKKEKFFFFLSPLWHFGSHALSLHTLYLLLLFLSLLHVIPFFIRLFVVFISSAMLFFCHEESTRLKLTPNFFVFFSFYCVCKCTNKRTQSVIDTDYKT